MIEWETETEENFKMWIKENFKPLGFYTNQLLPVLQDRVSHELLEEVKNNNL